jgi:hypothetical protein
MVNVIVAICVGVGMVLAISIACGVSHYFESCNENTYESIPLPTDI